MFIKLDSKQGRAQGERSGLRPSGFWWIDWRLFEIGKGLFELKKFGR